MGDVFFGSSTGICGGTFPAWLISGVSIGGTSVWEEIVGGSETTGSEGLFTGGSTGATGSTTGVETFWGWLASRGNGWFWSILKH